ncbi:hypothetical protein L2E82_11763 [Cichorium intybus]|uniref:Uncharacterized protein n=1 Tax=Cichorium intybus TaxID=13427 RepID=A0ACB9GDZ8_CICIN|nr:hypothetical protein L2E82_11763 [Cichorium intybus]
MNYNSSAFSISPTTVQIVNCKFINVLKLDHNHLTDQIPPELSALDRIKKFNALRPEFLFQSFYILKRNHLLIPTTHTNLSEEEINSMETRVTAMEKFILRLSLMELQMATNDYDFEIKNVIDQGDMGVMYTAVFQNGLLLAVKRLHRFESLENQKLKF